MRVNTFYPVYLRDYGAGYACQSIVEGLKEAGADVSLTAITCDANRKRPYHNLVIPPSLMSIGFKLFKDSVLVSRAEARFRAGLRAGDVAYIWPGADEETYRVAKDKGCIVVAEYINTCQAYAKNILDKEYERLNIAQSNPISDADVDSELRRLALVDFAFSPGGDVAVSLLASGFPEERILNASYGLTASDVLPSHQLIRDARQGMEGYVPTFVFAGRIGVRKGVHLLLDYWCKAGVKAQLKLVGNIEPDAMSLIEPYRARPDIEHILHTSDLAGEYSHADIFVLPSLEEGSPLVTYLALGSGLPCLVSSMGGGGAVEHGREGLVLAPHDEQAWVNAIRLMASDAATRSAQSEAALAKARHFVWPRVGQRRFDVLSNAVGAILQGK